jgi:hypothetical protein
MRDAVQALRQIILMEDRIERLSEQVRFLADAYRDLDRRLTRIDAKFELLERMAGPSRRSLPEKSGK